MTDFDDDNPPIGTIKSKTHIFTDHGWRSLRGWVLPRDEYPLLWDHFKKTNPRRVNEDTIVLPKRNQCGYDVEALLKIKI